jgi:hypothetical protein
MRKITLNFLIPFCFVFISFSVSSQQKVDHSNSSETLVLSQDNQLSLEENGVVRCASVEMHDRRVQRSSSFPSDNIFEDWLSPLVELKKEEMLSNSFNSAVVNIPIVFHVISSGFGPTNLSASMIQSQIDQLNLDFNDLAGSTNPVAASADINFIPAVIGPDGSLLAEPGINRVNTFGNGPFPTTDFDLGDGGLEIKPATVWDRSLYVNIWTADISGGILGYAQFPSNSTLPGFPADGGSELNDGVVLGYGTVGSVSNPGSGAPYNLGRTLTHEIGHWIGLRHIWGDGDCSADDFCNDTPNAEAANYGVAANTSCGSQDMVENYMDYTDDAVMNIFTFDQVARVLTVLDQADGISSLPDSEVASTLPRIFFGQNTYTELEGSSCSSRDISIDVKMLFAANANTDVTFINSGTATDNVDYEILNSTVSFSAGVASTQVLTLRLYEDDFIESNETIILNMNLSTTGDAVLAGDGSQTLIFNLIDDDVVPNSGSNINLVNEDFEGYNDFIINNIGDWLTIDDDGLNTYTGGTPAGDAPNWSNSSSPMAYQIFNPSTANVSNDLIGLGGEVRDFDPHGGDKYAACWAAVPELLTTANDDWLVSPVLSLGVSNNSVSFWVKAMSNSYGDENYNVGIYIGNGNPTSGADFTIISAASLTAPYGSWLQDSYDLSAYSNQDVRIGIHCVSSDRYMFMVDDFIATTYIQNDIQTSVNTATAEQMSVKGLGVAYAQDSLTNNVMMGVQNNDSFDYGCANISVSRSGLGATLFPNGSLLFTDKVFNVTTDNSNSGGSLTNTFYFTNAEINGWVSADPSHDANSIYIYRVVSGQVVESVSAVNGAYGSNISLTGTFTSLEGEYYFGSFGLLSIGKNEFSTFKIHPNPSNGIFNLSVSTNDDVFLSLFDISGREVYSKRFNTNEESFNKEFDFSYLSSGVYLLDIKSDNKRVIKKIIIK